jgi:hypothetical protein
MWFTDAGTTSEIGRITPSGQITEFSSGLQPSNGSGPVGIAAGADGNMWFTDLGTTSEIGRITPSGQITEFSSGLQPSNGSVPVGIAAGADGNMWFTDQGTTEEIGRIGAGVQAASVRAPSVTGSGEQGTQQVCQGDQWSPWAGIAPLASAFAFDGFQWLRDGTPIAGQTSQSYTPVASDVGHQLSCSVTVSYPLPLDVTTAATSSAITVIPQNGGPAGSNGSNGTNGTNGTSGSTGSQGPAGATGPAGPAGKIELVTCKTVKRNHKAKQACTTKLVSGPVKFTAAAADERAALSRDDVIYATGYARQTRAGVQTSLLAAQRLAAGRYTLTLTRRHGQRQITTRKQVTIT